MFCTTKLGHALCCYSLLLFMTGIHNTIFHQVQSLVMLTSLHKWHYHTLIPKSGCCRRLLSGSVTSASNSASVRKGYGQPKGYFDTASRIYEPETRSLSGLPIGIHSHGRSEPFLVLGIETSCDDTCAAVVSSDGSILSNIVLSQYALHQRFGGIVPGVAMAAHQENIDIAVSRAVEEAGLSGLNDIDAVAVTRGPGLEICLRVGCRKAQSIAKEHKKPLVLIHHLAAHCLVTRMPTDITASATPNTPTRAKEDAATVTATVTATTAAAAATTTTTISENEAVNGGKMENKVNFPFLALVASGGHTSLIVCESAGRYTLLGGTLDDALGESVDKAARILGILESAGSGGAAVEAAAARHSERKRLSQDVNKSIINTSIENWRQKNLPLPVPMRSKQGLDFSFSGLKNAFREAVLAARVATAASAVENNSSNNNNNNNNNGTLAAAATAAVRSLSSNNAPKGCMDPCDEEDIVTLPPDISDELCAAFQEAAFDHICDRVKRVLNMYKQEQQQQQHELCTTNHNVCSSSDSDSHSHSTRNSDSVRSIKKLAVVGGVAANQALRAKLQQVLDAHNEKQRTDRYFSVLREVRGKVLLEADRHYDDDEDEKKKEQQQEEKATAAEAAILSWSDVELVCPPPVLCTDNGVMVAWAGIERLLLGQSDALDGEDREEMEEMEEDSRKGGEEEEEGGSSSTKIGVLTGSGRGESSSGEAVAPSFGGGKRAAKVHAQRAKSLGLLEPYPRWKLGQAMQPDEVLSRLKKREKGQQNV